MKLPAKNSLLLFILFIFSLCLCGCASITSFLKKAEDSMSSFTGDEFSNFEAEMFSEIRGREARRQGGGNAQARGYKWVPPVVQKTKVPAMIRGGVFIPAHETYVIVTDGAYVTDDYKLNAIREKYRLPSDVEIKSPLKGDDVMVVVYRLNKIFEQSKIVDVSKISFLLDGKAIEYALSLHNDEIAKVGDYLCSFSREKGDDYLIAYISEGGLKQITQHRISKGQMLVLNNGYILAPLFERTKRTGGIN